MRKLILLCSALTPILPSAEEARAQEVCFDNQCGYSDCHTPAFAVPADLWGELEPAAAGALPFHRDSTDFNQVGDFERYPYWLSLDVENSADGTWIFALAGRRFQIWDATLNPAQPLRLFDVALSVLRREGLRGGEDPHAFIPLKDIDAPPGNTDLAVMVGHKGVGVVIWDTTVKDRPRILYQDHGANHQKETSQVYVTTLDNGRHYAFAAASGLDRGLFAYDLTAAQGLRARCQEGQPTTSTCPDVFIRRIGAQPATYVDGDGEFVVASGVSGFEIWQVSDPAQPEARMAALMGAGGEAAEKVLGVALFTHNDKTYLALRTQFSGRVYDVSCIAEGPCSLGTPLWTMEGMPFASRSFVTYSESNGVPFLHFGTDSDCVQGDQKEWLFDVRNPGQPRDITPQDRATIDGEEITYWGWYYRRNGIHGFNFVAPRMGKFKGPYFYRAGYSIFDVHRWIPPADSIFLDGFESGNLTSWDSTAVGPEPP